MSAGETVGSRQLAVGSRDPVKGAAAGRADRPGRSTIFETEMLKVRHHQKTKLEVLWERYDGLRDKVEAMFAEGDTPAAVLGMIRAQYGERLSVQTVARYKSQYGQSQRERVQQIGPSIHRFIGPSEKQRHDQSMI